MVDNPGVKGLEKLTSIRLAEILTQKGAAPSDVLTEALYAQDRHGEAFVEVLVATGHITEWDLAKIVVEQFQVPFLMAGSYRIDEEVRDSLPKEFMFRHMVVPLDRFDDVITVSMPILAPHEVLKEIAQHTKCRVYPYVGLLSENRKVLSEMFTDFFEFQKQLEKEREQARLKRSDKGQQGSDWMNIFDSADAEVRDSLKQ